MLPVSSETVIWALSACFVGARLKILHLVGARRHVFETQALGPRPKAQARPEGLSGSLWELSGSVWELSGSLWELSGSLGELSGSLWELSGSLWELSGSSKQAKGNQSQTIYKTLSDKQTPDQPHFAAVMLSQSDLDALQF